VYPLWLSMRTGTQKRRSLVSYLSMSLLLSRLHAYACHRPGQEHRKGGLSVSHLSISPLILRLHAYACHRPGQQHRRGGVSVSHLSLPRFFFATPCLCMSQTWTGTQKWRTFSFASVHIPSDFASSVLCMSQTWTATQKRRSFSFAFIYITFFFRVFTPMHVTDLDRNTEEEDFQFRICPYPL